MLANNQFQAIVGLKLPIQTTTDVTFNIGKHYTLVCDATSNAVTVNLPKASESKNRIYVIKTSNIDNAVIIKADGAELIDFTNTLQLFSVGDSETLQCDGVQWWRS